MELSDSKIKKIYYIFSKRSFSYISRIGTLHILSQSSKNKKSLPRENLLYSEKWKFHIFSQKKALLILGNRNP